VIKSLKKLISETEIPVDPCPLWLAGATPESAFTDLTIHYLTLYKDYLEKEKKSLAESLATNKERITEYRKKIHHIQCLDTAGMLEALQADVFANQAILEQVIKERAAYLEFMKRLFEDTKTLSQGADGILKEVCDLFKEFAPQYIRGTNEANKRFKSQHRALICPATMPEPALRERMGAKRDLLANDLGLLESDNEIIQAKLNTIDKKLSEIQKRQENPTIPS